MKFTVAAAVLTGSSSSSSSASSVQNAITNVRSSKDQVFHASHLDAARSLQAAKAAGPNGGKNGVESLIQGWTKKSRESALRNLVASEPGPMEECDPLADVGVLSCGPGRYCLESTLARKGSWEDRMKGPKAAVASMGGICVQDNGVGRRVQAYYTTTDSSYSTYYYNSTSISYPAYNYTYYNAIERMDNFCKSNYTYGCECTGVDVEAYVGSMSCSIGPSCWYSLSACGTTNVTICSSSTWSTTISGPKELAYNNCNSYTEPFVLSTCIGYTTKDYERLSCSMEVNGAKCNSCGMEEFEFPGYSYGNYTFDNWTMTCPVFDCTNTDIKEGGNLCYGSPTSTLLYESWPKPEDLPCPNGCSLCGDDNSYITNYWGYVNASGFNASCYSLQYDALRGRGFYTPPGQCDSLSEVFQEVCQCSTPTPPPVEPAPALRSSSSVTQAEAVAPSDGASGAHTPRMLAAAGAAVVAAAAAAAGVMG